MDTPSCPACTAPGLIIVHKGELKCSYCGLSFKGAPLICPSCGWINTIETEECPKCGEPLTVVAQVIGRRDLAGGPEWRKRVQSQLNEIRSAEEQASQIRLQALQDIDQKREEAFSEQKARQSKEERALITIALIIGLFIIASIIVIGVLIR